MAKHEHPQAPAPVFYPPGHPKHSPRPPSPVSGRVEQTAPQAAVQNESSAPDLGDVIRGIEDMARELTEEFFTVPDVADESGRVDPESFDAATRHALIACGNALDYAIRLITERGRSLRILKLRSQLADEMRAAGMTGDPFDGAPPMPRPPEQVG